MAYGKKPYAIFFWDVCFYGNTIVGIPSSEFPVDGGSSTGGGEGSSISV